MKSSRLIYLLIVILALWLAFISREVFAKRNSGSQNIINQYNVSGFSTDITKVVDDINASIVTISADSNISSGFVYAQNNDEVYIVTSYHGISSSSTINVTFSSTYTQKGEIVGYDAYTDLAIIKVITPYEMLILKPGDVNLVKKGEFVICIGTPVSADYAAAVELGMVSLKDLFIENTIYVNDVRSNYYLNMIELSADLSNGYSGSPIVNMNGEFIGMITMNLSSSFDFAVTSNEIERVADRIIKNEEVIRNNIGIKGSFVSQMYSYEKANLNISMDTLSGIYASRVKEGSLAFEAGIRSGDIILSVNGREIINLNDYLDILHSDYADEFTFEYLHNYERIVSGVKRD
ncbi:MAG: serine protease [Erysipelotrichaceae bacterium]|nr:serine protease [Erysipelotrichaceae bacterium]